jgi:hypothetical protein
MLESDRAEKIRTINNWVAYVINTLNEQSRRPNYPEFLKQTENIQKQIPHVRRLLLYLANLPEDKV